MKVSTVLVTLASLSLVLGLPVNKEDANRRSIQFNEESHDEAEALIQDFDDLSERLKAVESELKDGLELANEMEDDSPMRNDEWGVDRPAYINQEPERKRVCEVSEISMLVKNYDPEESTGEVNRLVAKLKVNLGDISISQYIESNDSEHEWHCFKYDDRGIKYVVVHKDKYLTGPQEDNKGICSCLPLSKKVDKEGEILQAAAPAMTMWDEWNDESDRYLNQMRMQQDPATAEPPTSGTEAECDLSTVNIIQNSPTVADPEAKELVRKLNLDVNLGSIVVSEYIENDENQLGAREWHCFKYGAQNYVVTHGDKFLSGEDEDNKGFCTCVGLATNVDTNGSVLQDSPAMTMWDEWNDESDGYGANRQQFLG